MAGQYRIIGAEMSPYSVKTRSYFRYKQIPHEWVPRTQAVMPEYQKLAKIPIIPLVVTPDGGALQDSTPILEKIEARHPEPSIHPSDPVAAFASVLLEEFGDEWGNKWMFHYRWAREVDQQSCGRRLVTEMLGEGADAKTIETMTGGIIERMVPRVWFVGSNEQTAPQIEATFVQALDLLDAHLDGRDWLFGGRPAFGDFGLCAQLQNAATDPTAGGLVAQRGNVKAWTDRFLQPEAVGEFEPWSALAPTLMPFLKSMVGEIFLPWTLANAKAMEEGAEEYTVELACGTWTQKPQKYHVRSLAALRAKYAQASKDADVAKLAEEIGAAEALRG